MTSKWLYTLIYAVLFVLYGTELQKIDRVIQKDFWDEIVGRLIVLLPTCTCCLDLFH